MKLIVGLGNPGEKYQNTRHNLGFMVAERFLKDFEPVRQTVWTNEPKFKSKITKIEWQPKSGSLEKIILVKPKTYMNESGLSVQLLTTYYKLLTTNVWVIHDDLDIPLGKFKIQMGVGPKLHNGIESIENKLGRKDFWRIRIGVDNRTPKHRIDGESYVLQDFLAEEKKIIWSIFPKIFYRVISVFHI